VVHDAFASIELAFLLAMGLPWEVARERMVEGWSNPVGGLLSFGHALGASGLVQVNKAHHLFCVDQRYLQEGRKRQGFREDGALAFTTSVGGPLSHVVGVVLRGGYQALPPLRQRPAGAEQTAPLSVAWRKKRYQLRLVLPSYLHGQDGAALIEGTTWVSIRSCLRALSEQDIARLAFEGIEELVAPEQLPELRLRLRTAVHVAHQESERLQSMFDVFRLLTDEMREIAADCRQRGALSPAAAAMSDEKLTDLLKECLRVPLAVICRPGERQVLFSPGPELAQADLVSREGAPVRAEPAQLPFWNVRAARPAAPAAAPPAGTATGIVDALAARAGGPHTAAELELLRLWFGADPPQALLDRALAGAGAATAVAPRVRAVFYAGEIADPGILVDPEAAHALLGRAAREARAYLEAYESSVVQVGSTLLAVAFERPPFRAAGEEPLLSAARFALELARGAQGYGIAVRAAACAGEGSLFEDLGGHPAVSSPAAAGAAEALERLRAERRPAIALVGASPLLVTLIGHRLAGWERAPDLAGAAVWLG
jgi:hypothetical protein